MLDTARFCAVAATALLRLGVSTTLAQPRDTSLPPVNFENGKVQLFVDDYLIALQSDVQRTLRQPSKDNGGIKPVIELADEFGETKSEWLDPV